MSFIEWDNVAKVNVSQIDTQHKKLVDLVNELYDAMTVGKGASTIGHTLDELIDYTKHHFALEESYMKSHNYPQYNSHKQMHDELTKQVVDLQEKFKSGHTTISVPTLNFLTNWLTNHIAQIDTQFGAFLTGKGISL